MSGDSSKPISLFVIYKIKGRDIKLEQEYYGFIYITTNKINGKKYIGKKSYGKNNKWKEYLGSGVILKKAIEKYGKENFSREILENCKTKEELNEKEKYWIKEYNAIKDDLFYNIASGGDGGDVIAGFSEERRNELRLLHSKRSKEYIPSCEHGLMAKLSKEQFNEIVQLLLDGLYDIEIGKLHNVNHNTISDIRNHKTCRKYTDGINFPKQIKRYDCEKTKKKIIQYDLVGNYISEYESARECERQTNIGYKLISAVCNGSKTSAYKYVFRFEGDSFDKYELDKHKVKVNKFDLDGNFIESFNSIKEAEKTVDGKRLDQVVNGKTHIACGYKWYRSDL